MNKKKKKILQWDVTTDQCYKLRSFINIKNTFIIIPYG